MTESMTFGPLEIHFDDRVLRPRPWTLQQARWAGELSGDVPAGAVAELCAGVGPIGLALATEVQRELVLVDADPRACELARANAEAAGLADRVDVRTAQIDAALRPGERFALMLADPPWVRSDGTDEFPDDPMDAIDGGEDGLEPARTCLRVISEHLVPGGVAILQLGDRTQARAVADHLEQHPDLALRFADMRNPDANGVLVLLVTD